MLIGYSRVSTTDQETATQVAALKAVGCERTYREKAAGGTVGRARTPPALDISTAVRDQEDGFQR
jgi:DNA invertase Pin-like site-specific DNA recombinase